jgi:hypothetical protein
MLDHLGANLDEAEVGELKRLRVHSCVVLKMSRCMVVPEGRRFRFVEPNSVRILEAPKSNGTRALLCTRQMTDERTLKYWVGWSMLFLFGSLPVMCCA